MKTVFFLNDKKAKKTEVVNLIGSEKLKEFIAEAEQTFYRDPYVHNSWFINGDTVLSIEFSGSFY